MRSWASVASRGEGAPRRQGHVDQHAHEPAIAPTQPSSAEELLREATRSRADVTGAYRRDAQRSGMHSERSRAPRDARAWRRCRTRLPQLASLQLARLLPQESGAAWPVGAPSETSIASRSTSRTLMAAATWHSRCTLLPRPAAPSPACAHLCSWVMCCLRALPAFRPDSTAQLQSGTEARLTPAGAAAGYSVAAHTNTSVVSACSPLGCCLFQGEGD